MNRYLIPRRITQKWELFPGWSWREIVTVGIGLVAGALLFGATSLLGLPIIVRIVPTILIPGAAVIASRPMPTSESLLDMLLAWRGFAKVQRLYLYDFGRDDT